MWYFTFNSSHLIPPLWKHTLIFFMNRQTFTPQHPAPWTSVSHKNNYVSLFVLDLQCLSSILHPPLLSLGRAVYSSAFHTIHNYIDLPQVKSRLYRCTSIWCSCLALSATPQNPNVCIVSFYLYLHSTSGVC